MGSSEGFREKGNRALAIVALLGEHGISCIAASVSGEKCVTSRIEDCKELGVGNSIVDFTHYCCMFLSPYELHVFACEGIQEARKITVIQDKFMVVVTKAEVTLYFTDGFHG